MGLSSGLTMLVGVIKTKLTAIIVGTVGVGLTATFTSIMNLFGSLAGLGLQTSAVKEIANAIDAEDKVKLSHAIAILKKLSLLSGFFNALLIMAMSKHVSILTFGTSRYALDICIIGLTVFCMNVHSVNLAIIQGCRKIKDLAKVNFYGAIVSAVTTVIILYIYGEKGISFALLAGVLIQAVYGKIVVNGIGLELLEIKLKDALKTGGPILKFGLSNMLNGLMVYFIAYLSISLINKTAGVGEVGVYSAGLMISGLFVGFVLSSMVADYYPKLSAIIGDSSKAAEAINQQTEIALLISVPGLIFTAALNDLIIKLIYTGDFSGASNYISWFVIGFLGKILSWPLSFVIMLQGNGRLFLVVETIGNLFHMAAVFLTVKFLGPVWIAFAFAVYYCFYFTIVYIFVSRVIKINWSNEVIKKSIWGLIVVISAIVTSKYVEGIVLYCIASLCAIIFLLLNQDLIMKIFGFKVFGISNGCFVALKTKFAKLIHF